jgi:hypothetical protein
MKKFFIYILPLIFTAILIIGGNLYMKYIAVVHIPCFFNLLTGLWCPGCGGTRSFNALMNGHILKSLHYNPAVILILIILILLYIQQILKINGVSKKILSSGKKSVIAIFIIMIFYYIIRNFIPFLQPL